MVHSDGAHAERPIRNILVIGSQDVARTICLVLSRLDPARQLAVLTYPSQTPPRLPASLLAPAGPIRHLTCDLGSAAALRAVLAGNDLVISTAGGGDYAQQARVVNACVAAGVPRFVAAEFGHDSLSERVQRRLPPAAERARVVRFLRGMELEYHHHAAEHSPTTAANGEGESGDEKAEKEGEDEEDKYVQVSTSAGFENPFEWAAVAVGTILDTKLVSGELGFDLKWQSATVHGDGTEEFAVTSSARVGEIVARVVERWEDVKNQYLYAAGCITTADAVVECLQKSMNRDWTVGKVDTEECVREANARLERGFPDAGMFLMERSVLYDRTLGAVDSFKTKSANKALGLEDENAEDIIRAAVHEFQHHGKAECGCN